MLERCERQKNGSLRGILYHQGESDSSPEESSLYKEKLSSLKKLRRKIGAKKVPLILGTLGNFYEAKNPEAAKINQILKDYAGKNSNVYIVSSAGLTDLGDEKQFNTELAQELGTQYSLKLTIRWHMFQKCTFNHRLI